MFRSAGRRVFGLHLLQALLVDTAVGILDFIERGLTKALEQFTDSGQISLPLEGGDTA